MTWAENQIFWVNEESDEKSEDSDFASHMCVCVCVCVCV
jgi:hypothetical protein